MTKQFDNVSAKHGTPMGRHTAPDLDTSPRSVRLFAVRLDSGGYDDGGAYWGLNRRGESLYCAIDKDGDMQFTRSTSRAHAAFVLNLPAPALLAPFDWRTWCDRAITAGGEDSADVVAYRAHCDIVESESAATRVVFRTWKDGDVIALFPDLTGNDRGSCESYEHVGQHGTADYSHVVAVTRLATPDEYAPLRRELESAPYSYNLKIRSRR